MRGERGDRDRCDVLGVHEARCAIAGGQAEFTSRDRVPEEPLAEVLREPGRAHDRPLQPEVRAASSPSLCVLPAMLSSLA
ncbi:hypothetical protein [Streptomyces sp. SRF1]|uniref:hypothetical protein n=1 Tax=Streptomyces sp. SRF1 TaxID=1549642 RepID=UPI00339D6649